MEDISLARRITPLNITLHLNLFGMPLPPLPRRISTLRYLALSLAHSEGKLRIDVFEKLTILI